MKWTFVLSSPPFKVVEAVEVQEDRIDRLNDPRTTTAGIAPLTVTTTILEGVVVVVVEQVEVEIDVVPAIGALTTIRRAEVQEALPRIPGAAFNRPIEMGSGICASMDTKSLEDSHRHPRPRT